MELVHSESTTVVLTRDRVNQERLLTENEDLLAGAVFHDVTDDEDYLVDRYWEAFSVDQYERVIAGRPDYVLGAYEADVLEQISTQYDSGLPDGCSYIQRVDSWEVTRSHQIPMRRRRRPLPPSKKISGWLVHDRPCTGETDYELLVVLCVQVNGPLIITPYAYNELGETEGLNDYGFTVRWRRSGVWQINYNPEAIERRPYVAARKEVTELLKGSWPDELLYDLFQGLHPNS